MLGIVVSLPRELRSLTSQRIAVGAWRAIADNTLVALSGIGGERAYTAGALLVSKGATALLSWGCAAALDDRLRPGCLILPERIIAANGKIHKVHAEWHQRLYRALKSRQPVRTELWLKANAILETPAEKRALPNGRKRQRQIWKAQHRHGLPKSTTFPLWRSGPLSILHSTNHSRKRSEGT